MEPYDQFIRIDEFGGNIGYINWINSDLSTAHTYWWSGLPYPSQYWGDTFFYWHKRLLQYIPPHN
ncbi:hypothetical protein b3_0119 [Synechococcus phage B3]|nr:hypothetical protein b3_0119 [Synechococcus phage B3]QGT54733.1 hypothetical protein b23_0118 [Synechococcus phage B23]